MKRPITVITLCISALLAGCTDMPVPEGPPIASQSYKLGAGDRLQITTFQFKDLSGEVEVAADGTLSFATLGTFSVQGMTPQELQQAIAGKLLEKQLVVNPSVSCAVVQYRPYRILGEVRNAGEYKFASGMTAMGAIAAAGGWTYRANRKMVLIRRENGNVETPIPLTASTPVYPGDTVRIGERYF